MTNSRDWWSSEKSGKNNEKNAQETFRVFSWNILAPQLVFPELYKHIDFALLDWNKRVKKILECILEYNPDIVTLQEMSESAFETIFVVKMKRWGYEGFFVRKSFSNHVKELEGVATFWRLNRFSALETQKSSLNFDSSYDRPQVACFVVLQDHLRPEEKLIVCNTHLLFNPSRGEVKLGQLQMLFLSVWRLLRKWSYHETLPSSLFNLCTEWDSSLIWKKAYDAYIQWENDRVILENLPGLLLCGDFNFTPNSCLYEWITKGFFDFKNCVNVKQFSGQCSFLQKLYKVDKKARENRGAAPLFSSRCELSTCRKENTSKKKTFKDKFPGTRNSISRGLPLKYIHPLQHVEALYLFNKPCIIWAPKIILHQAEKKSQFFCTGKFKNSSCTNLHTPRLSNLHSETISTQLYHPFPLCSGYARNSHVKPALSSSVTSLDITSELTEPAYTAYCGAQKGCIDYIWYSSNELKVTKILEFPQVGFLKKIQNIPHSNFPGSDHFFLVIDFEWTPLTNRTVGILL
ncbi:uncharacterized protein LOC128883536 isoform X2 [Hylaeus volcanicus]|uniref:uncharacterized protein LOC128883536 isoform X2 n=1 Tax=Hylaeus volcanicus TaxID=313075 RepID=UPI0023B842AD|nr:uncharacterized protein LOC128883536 isoform X2 [Hylaeus volcanicus]